MAEGDYRIGYYYYVKGDRRAAATRLLGVANRYPLYSKSDHVLWMMGDIFEKSEKKDFAGAYYARIVKDYPLSTLVPQAKDKLKAFGQPIPQADPTALAWMTAEANTPRKKPSMAKKPLALLASGPGTEKMVAARSGAPQMAPESDSASFGDLLKPNSGAKAGPALVANVAAGGSTANAETVGTSDAAGNPAAENGTAASEPATAPASAEPNAANANASPTTSEAAKPAAAENATATPEKTDAAAGGEAKAADANAAAPAGDAAKTGDSQSNGDSKDSDKDKKESSSKKKKGLKKLVPW